MSHQNRYIFTFLLILNIHFSHLKSCDILNPNNYGDCGNILGYVWSGEECSIVYGCDTNEDGNSFFTTFEECDFTCDPTYPLGDVNQDNTINVVDIVSLVSIILNDGLYIEQADLNYDLTINVSDIVALVNFILNINESRDTWQIINEDIITPKCAFCHYEGSSYSETSDLVLEAPIAYNQLINRVPDNQSANNNGLLLLSDSGGLLGLLTSFFWEKINIANELHFYSDHPQYAQLMPLGGPYLNNGELKFIERWIWEGAPEKGIVADPLILNDTSEYDPPEFVALDPPIYGVQYHIEPFDVYPNTEREFLYYVPPVEGEYFINRVEMSMAPGSHHFIAYQFSEDYSFPDPALYQLRDIHEPYIDQIISGNPNPEWMQNVMTLQQHIFVFGTQWPYWDYALPDGVALKFDSNYGFDLNPHYFNYTNETIQGEVYFNIHAILPSNVEHEAGILQLGNNDITLPPQQITTLTDVFSRNQILNSINIDPPSGSSNLNIFQLFSHAHKLMTRFDILILQPNGEEELIYTALDYEHPPILEFDPPLILQNNQSLISRVTYNNNTDDYVNFGLFSTDEMKIIFGLVYFD